MSNEEIIAFIRERIQEGKDKRSIRFDLISHEISTDNFDELYEQAQSSAGTTNPPAGKPVSDNNAEEDLIPQPSRDQSFGATTLNNRAETPPPPPSAADTAQAPTPLPTAAQTPSLAPIGEHVKMAWDIARKRIGVFLGVAIVGVLISFVLIIALLIVGLGSLLGFSALAPLPENILVTVVIALIAACAILYLYASIYLASVEVIVGYRDKVGVREALKRGFRRGFSYFWIQILQGILALGGFFFFGIPGLIMSIWFAFAVYSLVIENSRGMEALWASRDAVRGRWWKTLGRLLVVVLIVGVINSIATGIGNIENLELIGGLLELIVGLLSAPFMLAYTYVLYSDLAHSAEMATTEKRRKDRRFVVITTILGWIVAVVIGFVGITFLPSVLENININPLENEFFGEYEFDGFEDFNPEAVDGPEIEAESEI